MKQQPLFESTTLEDLHDELAFNFTQAVENIDCNLRGIPSGSEVTDTRLGSEIKAELEKIIGQFGLAIGLADTLDEAAEAGWNQPWMYFWNYVQLILSISIQEVRIDRDVKNLKKLALAFKARQDPPSDLLPDKS